MGSITQQAGTPNKQNMIFKSGNNTGIPSLLEKMCLFQTHFMCHAPPQAIFRKKTWTEIAAAGGMGWWMAKELIRGHKAHQMGAFGTNVKAQSQQAYFETFKRRPGELNLSNQRDRFMGRNSTRTI
jgi:hypothetical protein